MPLSRKWSIRRSPRTTTSAQSPNGRVQPTSAGTTASGCAEGSGTNAVRQGDTTANWKNIVAEEETGTQRLAMIHTISTSNADLMERSLVAVAHRVLVELVVPRHHARAKAT